MSSTIAAARPDPKSVAAAVQALVAKFGNRVVTSRAVREQHANTVTWIENQPPDAVVWPHSTEEVAEIVRLCARERVPVIPFGTGTSLEGHVNAPHGGVCIDLSQMTGVLSVSAEALDCRVQAGITRKQLNAELRSLGLHFPVDPGAEEATIGGMAATRALRSLASTRRNQLFHSWWLLAAAIFLTASRAALPLRLRLLSCITKLANWLKLTAPGSGVAVSG